MKNILLIICCLAATTLHAQIPTFGWGFNMGGTNFDKSNDIAVDAAGNVYAIGIVAGTGDFDPGAAVLNLVSNGNDDMFIVKYTAAGSLVWAYNIGGTGNETPVAMALDASGNCYITGRFASTVDFDPGAGTSIITASGAFDVYIIKINTSGNLVWAKNYGGTFGTFVDDLALDAAGNVYTIGTFQTTTDFDPSAAVFNLVSPAGQAPYMAKLDAAGNFVWAINTGFSKTAINIDVNNNLYLTGTFNNTTDFDPDTTQTFNLTPVGGADIHITKLDTDADFLWVKTIGGPTSESPSAINTDASGNIILTGTFTGTVDFDPGAGIANLTAVGSGSNLSDMYFLKLDAAANFVWVKKVGGNNLDYPSDIGTDNAGNVYFAGQFKSATIDFNPDTAAAAVFNLTGSFSSFEAFVLLLSSAGNFVYAYKLGGPSNGDDYANGICVNPSGSFYTTGTFYGPIDFDPGAAVFTVNDNGNTDAYIQKMNFSPTGILEINTENNFSVYPNPIDDVLIIESNLLMTDATVVDLSGRAVYHSSINNTITKINTHSFESGVYFVIIKDAENKLMTQKIIVN